MLNIATCEHYRDRYSSLFIAYTGAYYSTYKVNASEMKTAINIIILALTNVIDTVYKLNSIKINTAFSSII